MKLLEALELLKRPISEPASTQQIVLACGFTPLHLETFLAAHLRRVFPEHCIGIKTGLFGDLAGNLERLESSSESVVCVVIEWADLDRRLGIRDLGRWCSADIPDMVESARQQSARLTHPIKRLAENQPVLVSTPTLPLPPLFTTRASQAHRAECELREIAASMAASLSACRRARVVSAQRLDELSPLARRFDPKAEISTGFPYTLEHASRLAELLAELIAETPAKKGLITDLDDTLWAGILGEIGVDAISWEMSTGAHLHGLYQRFLDSLASAGVLLGAASKNDLELTEKALARNDILLPRERLFPIQVNWGPKSDSVYRILKQWNIASDDVVFIDDSPMEVAEVQAAFPQMECLVFPKNDYPAVWDLLKHLRDCFGKSVVSAEDEIRTRSIRATAEFREALAPGRGPDDFLRHAEAVISFSLKPDAQDRRAFELVNKTNQFNLNGRRFSESEWLSFFEGPSAFLLTASYEDKYGPLGKIAVVMGRIDGSRLHVSAWVMSCRAFSRRIEHQCLRYLFEKTGAEEAVLDYEATPRNGPMQDFLAEISGKPPVAELLIRKACFDAKAPALFHRITEVQNVAVAS